jgi:hypothetical protein
MPSFNASPTPITPPRVPLIDPRTGLIDRAWYMFFLSLFDAAQIANDLLLAPNTVSLLASYDAALQALAQNVNTQPAPIDLSAELTKQIQAANLEDCCSGLVSQVAEMQKQLEALNLLPLPPQSNLTNGTSILYGNGSGGFSNVALGSGVSFVAGVLSATGSGGTITSVTATAPVASSGGFTPNISISQSSTSTDGYLSSTDWNTFNGKGSGTVTSVTGTAPVVSSGGATPAISMAAANTSTNGYLTSTDWNTFNGKGSGTVTSVSFTGGIITVANPTTTPAFTVAGTSGGIPYFSSGTTWASSAALTQYGVIYGGGAGGSPAATAAGTTGQVLTATTGGAPTWASPATGGTVTSVSVVSANGFAGTVATATTTPAITLTTSITGLLKGNGTAISAAVANTDYMGVGAPVTKTADFTVANGEIWYINNKSGSTCTVTLPAASSWTGRTLTFKNMQAQTLVSASSNVVPIDSTSAGTAILLAVVGNWATMVSDGTNWVIMQQAANNCLLLE